tara:strand:- start:4843 stop:6936 length:2094 start_codon:yes stop_codon:yes gene_type:complete
MKNYSTENIINIALTGHATTGKTVLAESMVYNAGKVNKMGTIDTGTTVSDYREHEIQNQHSISLTLLNLEWKDKKINLLDAPGYLDFQGEVKSAMRVADLAGVVVSATDGIDIGTELCCEYADKDFSIPKFFIINMVEKDQANFDSVLSSLQERYGRTVFPFTLPVNQGPGFNQLGDVLRKKAFTFKTDGTGDYNETDAEGELNQKLDDLHNELIELIAESDESLMEVFFEKGELSEEELRNGLHQALKTNGLIPVFCVSGLANIGVKRMMDIISKYAPCAGDFEKVIGTKPNSDEEITHGPSINDPLSAIVFKTISEEHIGEMSFFRVYSGSVDVGNDLQNTSRNQSEKMRQVYFMNGKNRDNAPKLIAGDIGAALKLKNTHTGDTLADPKSPIILPNIKFPSPNTNKAIKPKARGDEEKIATGLSILHEEDPTFLYRVDPELKQTIVSGQGELHIDLALKRISSRFNVELLKETPKVPYRETITAKADSKYRHKKQSGGSGQFAEVWMRIEPNGRGNGIDFSNSLVGQNVDRGFVPSVEKGVNQICEQGVIAGCQVVDIKIDFYDGKMHPVDSNDMAFQIASRHAFSDAIKTARPKLLEPIYKIQVKVPDDYTGDVMGDISSRRGKVQGMDSEGNYQVINAELPLACLHDYSTALKAMSSGRGMFSQEFSHYEDMPHNEAEKVISTWEKARAAGE